MAEEEKRMSSEDLLRQARERYSDSDRADPARAQPSDSANRTEKTEGTIESHDYHTEDLPPDGPDRESRAEEPFSPEPLSQFPTQSPPPPPFEQAPRARGAVAILGRLPRGWLVFGLIALAGLVFNSFTEANRDDGGAVVDSGEVAADDIQVGDCLLLPEGVAHDEDFTFESIVAVPCTEPHDFEVYASFTHPADAYPGEDALFEYGGDRCLPEFERFTGVVYEQEARLVVTFFTMDLDTWSAGERSVECLIQSYDGSKLVGSQEGKGVLGSSGP